MSEKIDCIALHEAGHAVAHVLTEIPFKHVTIQEDKEKDENGQRSLGYIMFENPKSQAEWDQLSLLDPVDFNTFFKDDFTKLAGLVAERIYRGRFNYKSSMEDFRHWVGTSLNQLPERLNSRYIDFILEYTFQVLQDKYNWSNITAIALALVEEETLSYERVCEVVEEDRVNKVLK